MLNIFQIILHHSGIDQAEDNEKLSTLLSEGFKRPVYWNAYKAVTEKSYIMRCHHKRID